MRNTLTHSMLYAAPDKAKGGATPDAPAAVAAAAAVDPIEAAIKAAEIFLPFELAGFKLDVGKIYDQKRDASTSQKLCDVVLKLKGTNAAWYTLAKVNRVIPAAVGGKPARAQFRLALPSNAKGGGNYFVAVLQTDDPAAVAALDKWKDAVLRGPFKQWIMSQNIAGASAAANSGVGLVELDIDI